MDERRKAGFAMGYSGMGIVDRARARIAGRRDGKEGLVALDAKTGKAQSSFLAAERARSAAWINRETAGRIEAMAQAERDLRVLRGVYAGALGSLPDEAAVSAAEQARCEALEALRAYRAALDRVWVAVEACTRRYERLGQTYLRQAKVAPSCLAPCETPVQLNACEGRYAAFEKLVNEGYFDRHYD